eukprot:4670945-Pleurochrysis_carterae.AAC.3
MSASSEATGALQARAQQHTRTLNRTSSISITTAGRGRARNTPPRPLKSAWARTVLYDLARVSEQAHARSLARTHARTHANTQTHTIEEKRRADAHTSPRAAVKKAGEARAACTLRRPHGDSKHLDGPMLRIRR